MEKRFSELKVGGSTPSRTAIQPAAEPALLAPGHAFVYARRFPPAGRRP